MSSSSYLAAPAPLVEEATVEAAMKVEAATALSAAVAEAATVEPVANVEPATMYTTATTTTTNTTTISPGDLPAKHVRGNTGSDFESSAAVIQGAARKNVLQILLPCLYDERDFCAYGEVKYYVLVKDGLAYIYVAETDPKPLYAIELERYSAVLEDPRNPDKGSVTISPLPNTNLPKETFKTILLKARDTGKQAYQFTFDTEHDAQLANVFKDLVNNLPKKATNKKEQQGAVKELSKTDKQV